MPMRAPLTTVVATWPLRLNLKMHKNFYKILADKLSHVKNIRIFFIFLGKDLETEEKMWNPVKQKSHRFLYKIYKNNIFHFFWIKILLDSRNCGKCSSVFLIISVNTFPPKLHHLSILILEERLPMHKNMYFCKAYKDQENFLAVRFAEKLLVWQMAKFILAKVRKYVFAQPNRGSKSEECGLHPNYCIN